VVQLEPAKDHEVVHYPGCIPRRINIATAFISASPYF